MRLPFHKMQACGNDFVVVYRADLPSWATPAIAIPLCDRHFGVGADGVLVVGVGADVMPPELVGVAALSMEVWNADGSVSSMCGNGLRCVVRRALEDGRWQGEPPGGDGVLRGVMAAGTGLVPFTVEGELVCTELSLPVLGEELVLEVAGLQVRGRRVSVGNPHFVVFADAQDGALPDLSQWAPALEVHEAFPERSNIELVTVEGAILWMRVWERGVGETLACGSGACAVAAAVRATGRDEDELNVVPPGGPLSVLFRQDSVGLRGPAETVFRGTYTGDLR